MQTTGFFSTEEVHGKQKEWFLEGKTLPVRSRTAVLQKLRDVLKEHEKEIAEAVYRDFRKSWFRVRENELGLVYVEIRKNLKKIRKWSRPHRRPTSLVNLPGRSRILPQPYGNVLVISPWNYPVQLALVPVVSAIAAGNTVILKPSEIAANTSAILARLINDHFPPEILYVKEGGVAETKGLLSLRFDKIFFTGSTHVGRIVMKAAAEHLTPVTLELGGKNPVIVLPDCRLKMTARRVVWGRLHNGGQACVAADHVYVHEKIYDRFAEEVRKEIDQFLSRVDSGEPYPAIIDRKHYERIMQLVEEEKVVTGGKGDDALRLIEPTVMTGVGEEDPVMQEEIFGPVLPLLRFSDLDKLLAKLKRKPSPLALYIFSGNKKLAWKIQHQFRSGGGMVNDTILHFINGTPFGGIGDSGMGNYHGRAGFETFSHMKSVVGKPTWFELWVKHPPYTRFKLKLIKMILK